MKKSLGLLFAGTLAFSTVGALAFTLAKDEAPKEAKASVTDYFNKFFVGDYLMSFGETYSLGGGTVKLIEGTGSNPHTIELNGVHYEGNGIEYESGTDHVYSTFLYGYSRSVKIVVKGVNEFIQTQASNGTSYDAMWFSPETRSYNYTVTFEGEGSLKVVSAQSNSWKTLSIGVMSRMKIINNTATLHFESGKGRVENTGFRAWGGFEMSGGALTCIGNDNGMDCNLDTIGDDPKNKPGVLISGGTLNIQGGNDNAASAKALCLQGLREGRPFMMTGGTLNATSPKSINNSCGIKIGYNAADSIFKGGTVNASGQYGVYLDCAEPTANDYLTVQEAAIFTAEGSKQAINCPTLNKISGIGYSQEGSAGDETSLPVVNEKTTYSDAYKTIRFEIEEANYITRPTAKELVYNGEEQFLANDGEANHGEIVYRLQGETDFTYDIPKGKEVGTYTVEYKIEADPGYKDTEISTLTVTIEEKPAPGPTPPTPPGPTPTPSGGSSKAGLPAGAIVGIALGTFFLIVGGAYALLLFVFNEWIVVNGKAVRAFRLWKKEEGKHQVFGFPFRFVVKNDEEIFKTKEEAIK